MIKKVIRLAVLQRICPSYRVSLFRELSVAEGMEVILFIGRDLPHSKVKSAQDLSGINLKKIRTRFIKFGSRILPWHIGLIDELRKFKPDVILCEGESNFLGYLQAIFYRALFNKRVALIHWCFISLPGESQRLRTIPFLIKGYFRRYFDAFLLYSSYSKKRLLELGQSSDKAFVATNVGDVQKYLNLSETLCESVSEARSKLKLPERFTVLYLGTLDKNKRPEMMLDLAKECDRVSFNFVLLGSGPLLDELRERATLENLSNVFLPGRVIDELPLYYRAANVLLIPGRGGIVISEAMAFGLPVIVHQADGTEYDLIQNEVTGLHLSTGSVSDFRKAIEFLFNNPSICAKMGLMGKQLIESHFTTENMVNQIICAAKYAKNVKSK